MSSGFFLNLNSFTGATLNNTGCCEPPDTQIAVSATREFEAVNLTGFVFDRGGIQQGSFDLTPFMGGGVADGGSDPLVAFDSGSGRWFLALMVCQNGACGGNWTTMGVNLAVSNTGDPLGSWTLYQNIYSGNPFFDQGNLQDQPKLGFSDDKVTLSDNVYTGHCGAGSCFKGEDVTTFQKSDLTSAVSAQYVGFTSGYAFDTLPARPTPTASGTNNTQYLVWQGFGSLGVNQITGTPKGGDVNNSNTQSPGIGGMTATVDAAGVPSGAQSSNFTGSVTWEGNHLWASSTDGCTINGVTYDCTRIDEVDTSNPGAVSVLLDQNIGDAGTYEIYPAVTQDCLGEVVFGITFSDNSGTLPSAQAVGSRTPGSNYARSGYRFGDTLYAGGRWGDYSGVQEDPADCGNVWTAQEFGAVGSSGNWATGLGQFSFDAPTIFSTSPSNGPATGGTPVDIFGADFVNGGTSVNFGAAAASVTFVDSGHLLAVSPAGSGGPVSISVTTANGTSANGQFSWIPAVTGVSPPRGPTTGGNTVSITGAGFTGASAVSFGGVPASSFSITNDGALTALAPAGSAGTVDVTVTTGTGTSATSSADLYTYQARPTVSSVAPNAGPTAGGNTVTINGTNFSAGATVKFGGTPATAVTVISGSKLTAKAPARPVGLINVNVSTPGGTSASISADLYTYEAAPTVSSFTPTSGVTGTTITINGASYRPGVTVKFGTHLSPQVIYVSAAKITAVVPNGATTGKISVTTPGGTGISAANFTPTLSITGFTPTSGPTGTVVTISGVGFNVSTTVKFHGTPATTVTHISTTQLKANVPTTATSGPITVTNTTAPTGTVTSAATYTKT